MKLIRRLPTEKSKGGYCKSMALFFCEYCKREVKRALSTLRADYKSCGCVKYSHNKHKLRGEKKYSALEERLCLMCGKMFPSKGPHNRRCTVCEIKLDQANENTYYEPERYSYSSGRSKDLVLD